MFVCMPCLVADKIKVANKNYAILTIQAGMGSYGPCECCKNVRPCADV